MEPSLARVDYLQVGTAPPRQRDGMSRWHGPPGAEGRPRGGACERPEARPGAPGPAQACVFHPQVGVTAQKTMRLLPASGKKATQKVPSASPVLCLILSLIISRVSLDLGCHRERLCHPILGVWKTK